MLLLKEVLIYLFFATTSCLYWFYCEERFSFTNALVHISLQGSINKQTNKKDNNNKINKQTKKTFFSLRQSYVSNPDQSWLNTALTVLSLMTGRAYIYKAPFVKDAYQTKFGGRKQNNNNKNTHTPKNKTKQSNTNKQKTERPRRNNYVKCVFQGQFGRQNSAEACQYGEMCFTN